MRVAFSFARFPRAGRFAMLVLPLALIGATKVPWAELVESDWLYALATRFATVGGHRVHYPTPPAELAKLLEARSEAAALRHLADARLELGDRAGAMAAMEKWAQAEGPAAWDATARWAAAHQEWPLAFRAAERALPGLVLSEKRNLADARIAWAEAHPEQADSLALRKARAELFPEDATVLENWLRALEKADRLAEADKALATAKALDEERRLLLRSDLQADHGNHQEAFRILDGVVTRPWSMALRQAYAKRVDKAAPGAPATWRATLDRAFDGGALLRLSTYFQGRRSGSAAMDLLRQVERRHEAKFGRAEHLMLARLYQEIDALPEAFRATLAAAHLGAAEEQKGDLVALSRLALRAGGRPLALGTYNDESYHWAARVDRTPGFWTGNLSFLLTGLAWKESLDRLETDSLPDRTFAIARTLGEELARRAPQHPELFSLRAAIMERHVERGEGAAALALLPLVETSSPAVADEGRRVALLALRQVEGPLAEEIRLMKARLRFLAPDGSQPDLGGYAYQNHESEDETGDSDLGEAGEEAPQTERPWAHIPSAQRPAPHMEYRQVLEESISRLEYRDKAHLASLGLILGELDRLPQAESLWLSLAARLEGWNLDDQLGPRYEQALDRFKGSGIWARLVRWHAKRSHQADLRRLAEAVAQRFRASEIFSRTQGTHDIRLEIPEQPQILGRIRMVPWADWVRYKALERFPHSPRVFNEARGLMTNKQWAATFKPEHYRTTSHGPVVVPDQLMEERRWAIFFVDAGLREDHFAEAMKAGSLEQNLLALEKQGQRTPVEDLLLFEGWSRLSKFERAYESADRLAATYPGDGSLAQRVLSLHRSLSGLRPAVHASLARQVVERTAPALVDSSQLWTELGELEEERGRSQAAVATWKNLLVREPRNPAKIAELATLLWDYQRDAEALAVVEEGRARLQRPRFYAFETGVLRENLRDLEGAVREYLNALHSEGGSAYGQDQRSLQRLAQLLGRDRVFRLVERRIQSLKPGLREDEAALAAFFPLASLELPTPGQLGRDDDWMDRVDLPNDPTGRALRAQAREESRPKETNAIVRVGDLMLAKVVEMVPKATATEFLDAAEPWSRALVQARWKKEQILAFRNATLSRRAELAPNEEERIRQEMDRATFLAENRLVAEADAVWAALESRISALPDGVTKLRAEAARAGYLERAKGPEPASAEWRRLTGRHPWSLGLLEDRLAFLHRSGKTPEALALLEEVVAKAAAGHRESLLERLTGDSLGAGDLPRARRAVAKLLAEPSLTDAQRLGALHLHARLQFRESAAWDAQAFTKESSAKLPLDYHGDLYYQVARAADLESAHGPALGLWIEALNRKTDRDWLKAATRSAQKAGKATELLGFFEAQKQRSPRDVRWAVAVRDIRRDLHQVEGAIEAARSAVAVRPEREDLWREAAELMVRADKPREAADYLEGWNKPRPADEGVARWRSELYARAGDGDRALAMEAGALDAFRKEAPKDTGQLADRRARAAERLQALGLPGQAIRLYSKTGDVTGCVGSRLSEHTQATLALLTGQFSRLLAKAPTNERLMAAAARVLAQHGRVEQRDEVLAFVLDRIQPKGAQPNQSALNQWWLLVEEVGLEPAVRVALAERHLAERSGPWQVQPPLRFVESVGGRLVERVYPSQSPNHMVFKSPDLPGLWMKDLARRDRPEELVAFIEPRWRELMADVLSGSGSAQGRPGDWSGLATLVNQTAKRLIPGQPDRLPWAAWMDDSEVLATWARGASKQPDKIQELSTILSERRLWDRFWLLAARLWKADLLVELVPQPSRMAWYRFWETTTPQQQQDPVLVARRKVVESATLALANLMTGAPQAGEDPLILKLRGPQTVGEVLGKNSAWIWPEFRPRRDASGQVTETGEDRVTGTGVDEGRLPGALWGERPGEAWYVLESLARYRNGDATAALVPLDAPVRGGETDRTLLAIRLAKGQKNLPLAYELEQARPGAVGDRRRLESRIALCMATQRRAEAEESLRGFLKHVQPKMNEGDFLWTSDLAREHGLPAVMDLLDPQTPVGPAFLAYLVDRRKNAADRFRTQDPMGFRVALAARWAPRERQLSAEQVRYWLFELWARDNAPLPLQGMAKLGVLWWPHAAAWLERQAVPERAAALSAVDGVAQPGPGQPGSGQPGSGQPVLLTLLAKETDDVAGILTVRAHLLRGESAPALARVDAMLADFQKKQALSLSTYTLTADPSEPPPTEGEEGGEEGETQVQAPRPGSDSDPLVDRLKTWLVPFQKQASLPEVEGRFRKLLKAQRDEGSVSTEAWRLAFRLAPAAELPALSADLDAAWFRGDVAPEQLGTLCGILATVVPADTPRWLARWPRQWSYAHTRERANLLAALKQPDAATRTLFEARRRTLWMAAEDTQAFDLWRRLGALASTQAPAAWREALPFWTAKADGLIAALGERLKARPQDLLSSRAALRHPTPADEQVLFRVALSIPPGTRDSGDQVFLDLRTARGLLPTSWRAASRFLGSRSPGDIARLLVRRRMKAADIDACLADLARLASQKADGGAQLREALALLEERKAPAWKALQAELLKEAPTAVLTYRMVNGRPASIAPRDLTWATLAQVLKAEGVQ